MSEARGLALAVLLAILTLSAVALGTLAQEDVAQDDVAQDDVARDDALSSDPGFVDFSRQQLFDDDDLEIHVSVKDPMIKLVAEATRENDPVLADVLQQLRAVEVHVYQLAEDERDAVRHDIARQARELEGRGWDEAVTIHLKRARGHVFLRLLEGRPVGLAAMYVGDENEAVFVNIVGPIDPAQVGRLASQFNLDLLSRAVGEKIP